MANFFDRFWSATMAGYKAFQANFMQTDHLQDDDFISFDSRKLRYAVLWSLYENTTYNKHSWSDGFKTQYGLYQAIRNIYNPSYRMGEFWKAHLLGGKLDPLAGDGEVTPSTLPIVTENETLRPAIAKVWQWSNWQIKKDVFGLWTPVLGDGIIKVIDNPQRRKVYFKVIHPGTLADVTLDDAGNVKGYVIEKEVDDPRPSIGKSKVTYREVAVRDGKNVSYKTYLNNSLYAWNKEQGKEWDEPIGFVPMVVMQHNDVGLDFGHSELYPGLSKFREVDDQASKLSDQVRIMVDAPWLMAGVSDPSKQPKVKGEESTKKKPAPGRQEIPMFYGPADAKAYPLVAPLDIAAVVTHIEGILKELEKDFPELSADLHNVQGDISGRALRLNREPVETKVLQRRPNYDNAIVRAQQMAIALAGERGYDKAFEGFSLDSYDAGDLDHLIGERPVFAPDPQDEQDEETALWTTAGLAKDAGVDLDIFLELKGWPKDKIAKITNSPGYKARMDTLQASADAAKALANGEAAPARHRFGK